MMKKKISILTLTILFLVSTTGLPIWSHYCEMMGKSSSTDCEMCKADIEQTESDCCSEQAPFESLKITVENSTCCVDAFDYKKIEDIFSQTGTTVLIPGTLIIAEINLSSFNSEKGKQYSLKANCNLPPPKFGKQLLHTIHQLKIDLPVC